MFKGRFEKAMADWPKTAATGDGGVHITGKYDGPWLYRQGDTLLFLGGVGIAILLSIAYEDVRTGLWFMAAYYITCVVFGRAIFHYALGNTVSVRVYPDRITLPGLFWRKNYSRQMPIELRIDQHHKAIKDRKPSGVYRRAIEVVLQYGEKRVPIAAMPEENMELARALVIRLQNACADVDLVSAVTERGTPNPARRDSEFGPVPDIR